MSTREAAAQYIAKGWYPLPLKPNTKDLRDRDGLRRVYTADEFNDDDNIGLRLVSSADKDRAVKLVAVDFDAEEITADAVKALLPWPSAGWGRESKTISQVLYITPIDKAVVLKDTSIKKGRATLVEIRVDHQSMCPPSVHPNGEQLRWLDGNIEPLSVVPDDLRRAVRLIATYALVARHYPPEGARHYFGLYLIGMLRSLRLTEDETHRVLELAGRYVRDRQIHDRLDAVRGTYAKNDDDPVGGASKLVEEMGDSGAAFVTALRKIWGEQGDTPTSRIDEMNKKHALIFQTSGELVVMTEDPLEPPRFSKPNVMPLLYPTPVPSGRLSKSGSPLYAPLGQVWLTHPKRRMYQGVELAPTGGREGYYNMWKGWSVEPKPGDWSLYREQLRAMTNYDAECEDYVLAWLAETVRHPDKSIGTCLAFHGKQGTGKSTFAKWFGSLFGAHFLHLDSEQRLLGQFNSHLQMAIVVLADEAVWAGGKQGLGALKRMITEETLAIERKYFDTIVVPNRLHVMIASNEDWFVPRGLDDRRFAVFDVSDKYQGNHAFFGAVQKQLFQDGGLAGLLYDLLEGTFTADLRKLPRTVEGERQKQLTMDPMHSWWFEELSDGTLWTDKLSDGSVYSTGAKDIYRLDRAEIFVRYERAALQHGVRRVGSRSQLGIFLSRVLPLPFPQTLRESSGKRVWIIPSLEVCRAAYAALHKGVKFDDDDLSPSGMSEVPF